MIVISSYLAILSAARKTPAKCVILAGGLLVRQADHTALSSDLFPALSRAVKRNSEVAVPCMVAAVKSLKVDSSRYFTYLVDTSMFYFKQATPETTDTACALLHGLAALCSDGEALATFSEALLKEMDASRSNPAVKRQVYLGLRRCLQGLDMNRMGKALFHSTALRLQEVLLAALKKETNPAAKAVLIDCLGQAVLAAESATDAVMTALLAVTQPTSNVLLPALCALSSILRSNATLPDVAAVRKTLESAIARAIAKPFLCGREGIISLPALLRLVCCVQGERAPACVVDSLKEGSFFFQSSLYTSANREDDLVIEACQTALRDCVELAVMKEVLEEKAVFAVVKHLYSQIVCENMMNY